MDKKGFVNTIVETTIHLLPSKVADLENGIRSVISRVLMSYNNDLEGIIISYDKLQVLEQDAEIFFERPHLHFKVRFRVLLYRPVVGAFVEAVVNNISDTDHIGLLVHGLFNAVILPTKGALPQEYSFSQVDNIWKNENTQEVINVGTRLRLKITRIERSKGLVALQCAMGPDMTGIIQ
jgi:DNA-directed RNA polymerase subunit E'/Rpb7